MEERGEGVRHIVTHRAQRHNRGVKSSQKFLKFLWRHLRMSPSLFLLILGGCQWMIAQMVERLLCTRRTQVQIPAQAPYEITFKQSLTLAYSSFQ